MYLYLQDGIERVDAAYETFLMQRNFEDFRNFAFELQTDAKAKLNPKRIREYLEIIKDTSGADMCCVVFHYIIVVLGKYLQMMVAYHIHKEDPDRVTKEFEFFNSNYEQLVFDFTDLTGLEFIPGNIPNPNVMKTKLKESLPKPVKLDPKIVTFLENLKLGELKKIFEKEELTMEELLEFSGDDLKEIGIRLIKHRKAILKGFEAFSQSGSIPRLASLPSPPPGPSGAACLPPPPPPTPPHVDYEGINAIIKGFEVLGQGGSIPPQAPILSPPQGPGGAACLPPREDQVGVNATENEQKFDETYYKCIGSKY